MRCSHLPAPSGDGFQGLDFGGHLGFNSSGEGPTSKTIKFWYAGTVLVLDNVDFSQNRDDVNCAIYYRAWDDLHLGSGTPAPWLPRRGVILFSSIEPYRHVSLDGLFYSETIMFLLNMALGDLQATSTSKWFTMVQGSPQPESESAPLQCSIRSFSYQLWSQNPLGDSL